MRLALAIVVVTSLAWSACSTAGPPPVTVASGQSFSLRTGEVAQADDGLRIGFDGVAVDSRCPKGEQCIQAGDAIVRIWLQRGDGTRQVTELHSASGKAQAATLLGHEVRLVRLEPHPVTGRAIAAADYVATLNVGRGTPTDPER